MVDVIICKAESGEAIEGVTFVILRKEMLFLVPAQSLISGENRENCFLSITHPFTSWVELSLKTH